MKKDKYREYNRSLMSNWMCENNHTFVTAANVIGISSASLKGYFYNERSMSVATVLLFNKIGVQCKHEKIENSTFFLERWAHNNFMTLNDFSRYLDLNICTINRYRRKYMYPYQTTIELIALKLNVSEGKIEREFNEYYNIQ